MAIASVASDPARARAEHKTAFTHVALIVVSAIAVRVLFYLAYKPIWVGDSPSYALAHFFWAHKQFYLGERTPVYPLFLGLAQWVTGSAASILLNFRAAYTVLVWQALLDIAACVAVYFTSRWLNISGKAAAATSIFLVTLAGLCLHEMLIVNMSLAFANITIAGAMYVALLRRIDAGQKYALLAFGLGIVLAIGILDRPELLLFTVVLVVGTGALRLTAFGAERGVRLLSSALLIMLGVAPLLLVWMSFMYAGIGEFRITTLDGWNRSRTVYNLFDRVGPEDRALGAVLTRSYQAQRGKDVNLREHMFVAFDDLAAHYSEFPIDHSIGMHPSTMNLRVAGLAYRYLGLQRIPCAVSQQLNCYESMRARIELGDYIGQVSTKLIRRYPGAWLKNVFVNWFHESFNFDYVDAKPAVEKFDSMTVDGSTYFRNKRLANYLEWLVRMESPFLTCAYIATLIFVGLSPFLLKRDAETFLVSDSAVAMLALAAVGTVALMCAIAGFNRIYHVPFLAIFVISAIYAASRVLHRLPTSRTKAED